MSTHGKVNGGDSIENDEDVLVRKFGETDIQTNWREREKEREREREREKLKARE